MSPIPDGKSKERVSVSMATLCQQASANICEWLPWVITQQFADEGLSLERLKVVDVFSRPDEDDGAPGGRHADRKQQQKKKKVTYCVHTPTQ